MNSDEDIDKLHKLWQDKIDNGFRAYIMDVTGTCIHHDNKKPSWWIQRYLLPFEKDKINEDIEEWKELMTHDMIRGEIKIEKKKSKCTSVEELYEI